MKIKETNKINLKSYSSYRLVKTFRFYFGLFILISTFLWTFGVQPSQAATSLWQPVPLVSAVSVNAGNFGGEGGQVPQNIAIDSTGNFIIFGTDVGGIYYSNNAGARWQPCNVGLESRGACAFAIDPNNVNRVLAVGCNSSALPTNGLYLTTNGTASWTPVLLKSTQGASAWHDMVAFDGSSTTVTGGVTFSPNAYWICDSDGGGGLWKSTNGGVSWSEVTTQFSNGIVKVNPSSGVVYVATANGFFYSTNGGTSFTQSVTASVLGLDVISAEPNNVYINESDGVWISTNSGMSFTEQANTGLPTTDNPGLRNVKVSPGNPNNMCIDEDSGSYNEQGYYYTTNGGSSWSASTMITTNSFIPTNERPHLFAWNPQSPNEVWSFGGDYITNSTSAGATFSWDNNGYNGEALVGLINFNIANPNEFVVNSQDYDSAYTGDGGMTWLYLNASGLGYGGFNYSGYAINSSNLVIGAAPYWGGSTTMTVSTNGGGSWASTGESGAGTNAAIGDPNNSSVAFWNQWRTTNSGAGWSQMTGCTGVYDYDPNSPYELYGADGATVVKSTNDGVSWTAVFVEKNSANYPVNDVAFDGTNGYIYCTTGAQGGQSLYRYTISTGTLTDITGNLQADIMGTKAASSVATDPGTGTVYVSWAGNSYMTNMGVQRSLNSGGTFSPLTLQIGQTGLDGGHEVSCVRVNPSTHYLYAACQCFGLWKYPPPSSGTATVIPTSTLTSMITNTSTATKTPTATATFTPTFTFSSTATATSTSTPTSMNTNTSTATKTPTATATFTPTFTFSSTATATSTSTPTSMNTNTSTATKTPTATATFTSTFTFSRTATFAPTPTMTATPRHRRHWESVQTLVNVATSTSLALDGDTPSPTVSTILESDSISSPTVGVPIPYPNPVSGSNQTVQVQLSFNLNSKAELELYTVGFRRISELDLGEIRPGEMTVTLPLRDRMGAGLANGLYYLVVQTSGGPEAVGKMLILR